MMLAMDQSRSSWCIFNYSGSSSSLSPATSIYTNVFDEDWLRRCRFWELWEFARKRLVSSPYSSPDWIVLVCKVSSRLPFWVALLLALRLLFLEFLPTLCLAPPLCLKVRRWGDWTLLSPSTCEVVSTRCWPDFTLLLLWNDKTRF